MGPSHATHLPAHQGYTGCGENSHTSKSGAEAEISLAIDASNTHIGAVLKQWQHNGDSGSWGPLAFFSKKLDAAQLKYVAFNRELLAAYLSVRHFRYMLVGR